jgi:ribonucleoside-diphosphate reductase subunit M1
MPTASTAQILGNSESFEPYTSNIYTRRVLAGEFMCVNPHLVTDLVELGLWSKALRNRIIANNGSVQNIKGVPDDLKKLYKTNWEIRQKAVIDLAASRGPFVDQSQSMSIYMSEPNYSKMCSMHFYAWKQGLKTGMYYLRSRPAADAIKFTVDFEMLMKEVGVLEALTSPLEDEEEGGNKEESQTTVNNVEAINGGIGYRMQEEKSGEDTRTMNSVINGNGDHMHIENEKEETQTSNGATNGNGYHKHGENGKTMQ